MAPSRGVSHPFLTCQLPGFAHFNLAASPFYPDRLAVASSQNFGLVGNGRLHVLRSTGPFRQSIANPTAPAYKCEKAFDTQDGLYDVAWSEIHENQLVSASGDGSLKLWDITLEQWPITKWHEHTREVYSVDWNNLRKELFVSASWDQLIKVWTPERPASINTIKAHSGCVYQASFAPHQPDILASCAADGQLNIWDLRQPSPAPQQAFFAHPTEVLCLDWNKYNPAVIATGSVDRTIKIHDLRLATSVAAAQPQPAQMPKQAPTVATLVGHEYAVRKVAWSPYGPNLLASASYDMTCRIWDVDLAALDRMPSQQQVAVRPRMLHDAHTEFVVGAEWSLFEKDVLTTCSWDQSVHVFAV